MIIQKNHITLRQWLTSYWIAVAVALAIYGQSYDHALISVSRVASVTLIGYWLSSYAMRKWPEAYLFPNAKSFVPAVSVWLGLALLLALSANLLTFLMLGRDFVPPSAYLWDYLYFLLFTILAFLGWSIIHARSRNAKAYLALTSQNMKRHIALSDIQCIKAEGDYVGILTGRETLLYHATIKALEKELKPSGFMRVHRSYLVNAAHVSGVRKEQNQRHLIVLTGGMEIPVSRNFSDVAETLVST